MFARAKAINHSLNTEAIRQGDPEVFEVAFKSHYEALCRYACTFLSDSEEAEDTVQQVFVNYWQKRSKTIITGSLKSFLYKSVQNACLNKIKHKKVVKSYMDHSSYYEMRYSNAVEEHAEANELSVAIDEALIDLPPQCQKIFKMSRYEELKYKEIAEQLSISIKTVENQMGKALKILRVSLSDFLISLITLFHLFL